jgi:kexin
MVSGAIALMLAVRPDLTWRDVRLILAETARQNDRTDAGWTSHFGYRFNHKYGFGTVDAHTAVQRAQSWASVGGTRQLLSCGPYARTVERTLPGPPADTSVAVVVTSVTDSVPVSAADCPIRNVEFVEIGFTATHSYSGDLRIALTSPGGLLSELANERVCYQFDADGLPSRDSRRQLIQISCGGYEAGWTFGSVRHLGESTTGSWTMTVTDMQRGDEGVWHNWSLRFWGRP